MDIALRFFGKKLGGEKGKHSYEKKIIHLSIYLTYYLTCLSLPQDLNTIVNGLWINRRIVISAYSRNISLTVHTHYHGAIHHHYFVIKILNELNCCLACIEYLHRTCTRSSRNIVIVYDICISLYFTNIDRSILQHWLFQRNRGFGLQWYAKYPFLFFSFFHLSRNGHIDIDKRRFNQY